MGNHTNATGQQKQYTITISKSKHIQTWKVSAISISDDACVSE